MKRLLALFFLIIFFAACGPDRIPKGVIKEDKMTKVLIDIHLADGYASMHYADSTRQKVAATYSAVYKKHNTDSAQVRSSIDYYTRHPDKLQLMYEQVNAELQKLETRQYAEEERQMQTRMQRESDSLEVVALKADTLHKGFLVKSRKTYPFTEFVPRARPVFVQDTVGREEVLKPAAVRKRRQRP